jgi:predicted dehydrogenase
VWPGCGHWGKNLVRNFHQLGRLGGLFDASPARLAEIGASYPEATQFASFEAALADPAIHAVAIATPAEMHARMAIQALDAGKDAFVEKPLALTAEDGTAMVAAARRNGRLLMVGHLLIYHPAIVAIRKLIADGELGRLEYLYSNRFEHGQNPARRKCAVELCPARHFGFAAVNRPDADSGHGRGRHVSAAEHRRRDRIQSAV